MMNDATRLVGLRGPARPRGGEGAEGLRVRGLGGSRAPAGGGEGQIRYVKR